MGYKLPNRFNEMAHGLGQPVFGAGSLRKSAGGLADLGPFDLAESDERDQLVGAHAASPVGAVQDTADEFSFVFVHRQDLLFNRVPGDEAIDGDGSLLTQAVGAVGGLILDGRVPPWIHVDDIIGCGQIQTGPARFEGDQEEIPFAGLESIDGVLAFCGGRSAIEVLVRDSESIE